MAFYNGYGMNYPNYSGAVPDRLTQLNTQYQPPGGSFIWVNSRKEAEEYPLGANGAQMMMNRNEKVFYLKACDGFGMVQSFREFPYYEKDNEPSAEGAAPQAERSAVEYVKREEFEALKAEIEALRASKRTRENKEAAQNDK